MSILSCKNLVKEYVIDKGSFKALDDVSLEVQEGDYIAVTGESGSGKTTLLNLIGLIDRPTSGEVMIDGKVVAKDSKTSAKLRNTYIGYVFQNFYLDPNYTAAYNVEIPLIIAGEVASDRKARVEKALNSVGLQDKANVKCGKLSGGEKQRVCIARAVINNPSVVLADEPCGNLDSVNTAAIMDLFEELNRSGTTVVMVTHSHDDALRAKTRVTMKDGKIVEIKKA